MTRPETHHFDDGGGIPNSRLPVLVYHAVEAARAAHDCEQLFARNAWLGAWVDGIYPFHHFHSKTHEVLGIVAGSASVLLGGPGGRHFEVGRGDVLVLPAGTGHCGVHALRAGGDPAVLSVLGDLEVDGELERGAALWTWAASPAMKTRPDR